MVPSSSIDGADLYLNFQFTSEHPCVITVYQGNFEKIVGLPITDPMWNPSSPPLKVNFVPLKDSPFEHMIVPAALFNATTNSDLIA